MEFHHPPNFPSILVAIPESQNWSEHYGSPRAIVVSFLLFGFLLAWVSSGLPELSSTNSDTGTGEMSLLVTSFLSRTDKSPTVGEEGEDEEDDEERLSCGSDGQAADAVSAYTQVKMEDAHKLLKIPKSECPDIWIRLPRHKMPKSWSSMEDPVVPLEKNLYGHPLAGLLWKKQFEKILLKHGWGKIPNWECLFVHREKGLFLCVYVDDIKLAGKKQNIDPMWKVLNKEVDLGEPTSFLDHENLGCTQRQCEISKDIVDSYSTMFESRVSEGATEKLPCSENMCISSWSYDMEGHAKKCVERYCELANKTNQQLYKVSTPCIDDHHFKEEDMKSVGELSKVCSQIVPKCSYLARSGRPDILWSVNKFARSITKWSKACDKRLNRLTSYIHHTCEHKQHCNVGNTAKQCRLGLFQYSDFAGDLEDSKSTSGGTLCVFGKSHVCANKLDVQETNFSFAQLDKIRNHLSGRWTEIRRDSCSRFVGSDRHCSSRKHESE